MSLKIKKRHIVEMSLLYLLYIMHGTNIMLFTSMITDLFIFGIIVILRIKYKVRLDVKTAMICSILLLNYIITGVLSGASAGEGYNFTGWLYIVITLMTVKLLYTIDTDVMSKFIHLVFFFSAISLVCYFIVFMGAGSLLQRIFRTYTSGMGVVSGKWFYVYNPISERNSGIFTEPGIFQLILVMCLFVMIFLRERISIVGCKYSIYMAVLIITIITTKSAAGYLGLLIIVCGVLLKRKEKRDVLIFAILLIGVAYLLYDFYTNGNASLLQTYFFGKFAEVDSTNYSRSSGGARMVTMTLGIESALHHPFGIGYLQWQEQIKMIYGRQFGTGNALFSMLGIRGFGALLITLYLALTPAVKNRKDWLEAIIFIILYLYITTVQSNVMYPATTLVAFLGMQERKNLHEDGIVRNG